jgi:hypothetical protein
MTAGATAGPPPQALQAAEAVSPFARLLPADCVVDGGDRFLPRRKLVERVLKDHPIIIDAASFSGPELPMGQRIAKACDANGCHDDGYGALNKLAVAMLTQRSDAQFQLVWIGQGGEPEAPADRIAAFYDLSRATYRIRCIGAPPPPPDAPQVVAALPEAPAQAPSPAASPDKPDKAERVPHGLFGALSKIRIASAIAETDKSDYTKRDPAKLSYVRNAANDDAVLSVKAVAVTPAIASWGDADDKASGYGTIKPFVGYERISSQSHSSEINNVDLGLRGQYRFGQYDGLPAFNGALSAAYETDDRFKSSLTRIEATLSPPWAAWLRERHLIQEDKNCVWCQSSGLTLTTDYVHVGNPGDKTALYDLPQFARVGFDAGWSVQWKPHPDMASLGLDVQLADRQDVTGNSATASRLTTRATYYPSAASHVVLGLQYDKGKDLSSLTPIDTWMITWGYRQ